jgi:pimeloyl-ACP methyl ester carboxylesterase
MNETRRLFLLSALTGLAGTASLAFAPALAGAALPLHSATDALRAVAAAQSTRSYHAAGPEEGRPIVLARSAGQDVERYAAVASLLAAQGYRVLVPALRDAEPAELGQDLIAFIDSLHIPEAVFVGIGQGGQAVRGAADVRRSRVVGFLQAEESATPQQIADAAATLARQGKWRT